MVFKVAFGDFIMEVAAILIELFECITVSSKYTGLIDDFIVIFVLPCGKNKPLSYEIYFHFVNLNIKSNHPALDEVVDKDIPHLIAS